MTPAEILALLVPLLPTIERLFREAWGRTDDFEIAWGFLEPFIRSDARTILKPIAKAAWDTYEDGQIEEAWAYLSQRVQSGDGITRAVAPSFEEALAEQHHRADQLEGSATADDAPPTIPVPPEFDPPHFDDGEIGTEVEVPHPHGKDGELWPKDETRRWTCAARASTS